MMKVYESPTVALLYLENEDILTVSDPMIDDPWDNIEF